MTTLETDTDLFQPLVPPRGMFSFIVPAYNEAAVLQDTVTRIAARLRCEPGCEILIVENGSTDDTWAVAQRLAARLWPEISVRALRTEKGLAEAYRAGARSASGRHVVFTAADLPFGFTDLDAFLDLPGDRPVLAIGSKAHPDSVIERSIDRRLMSLGFRVLRWAWLSSTARDPQGSLIVEADLADRLVPQTEGPGFIFGTELAALARTEGVRAVELPVELVEERRSSTVRPLQDSWRMLCGLVALRRRLDARADEGGRRRLATGTGPGPVLERLVGRRFPAAATTALASAVGVVSILGAIAVVAAVLRWSVLDRGAAPTAAVMLATTAATVAVVAVAIWLVRRLLLRTLPPPPRPAGPHPAAVPSDGRGDRRRVLLAGGAAAAAAVALTLWRVLPDITTTAVGSGDARYWYWVGWRLAEQMRAGDLFPGGIDTVVWPMGYSIRVADGFLPAMVGALWNLVLVDPTVAFNAATATAVATTALAGVRLARTVGAGPATAGIAGLALAIAPALFSRAEGHYNLLFAFPAVLLIDVGLRHVLRRTQPLPVFRTASLLVLSYLSSGYYLVYGGLALAVILVAAGLGARRLLDTGLRLGVAVLVAVVVLSPFLVPKMQLERREAELGAVPQSIDGETFASDATSVFTPSDGTLLGAPGTIGRYRDRLGSNWLEATAYPGALAVLGFGALLLFRSPARRPLVAATAVLWVLSLGTTLTVAGVRLPPGLRWLPTTALVELPGFAGMRTPNRSSFVLAPIAVAAAVVVLTWTLRRSGLVTRPVVLGVAAIAVAASVRVPMNRGEEPSGPLEDALSEVRQLPDAGAVLHLPDDCIHTVFLVEYQVLHQRPLVGCQGFTSAIPWRAQLQAYAEAPSWAALRCEPSRLGVLPSPAPPDLAPSPEAAVALRSELGVGVVIFHTANLCPDRSPAILDALTTVGRVVGRDGSTVVVALPPSPQEQP